MIVLLTCLLAVPSALVLIPAAVLLSQSFAALPRHRVKEPSVNVRSRLAILVPAHNEAAVIKSTIDSILPQLGTHDRLLVVADNCSDDTADIARSCGAEVAIRADALLRGKGYALDFGIRHLAGDPPEILVMVDADCELSPQALDRLAGACAGSGRPVQALYLMRSPAGANLKMRIAEFAWVVRNWVRPLGWLHLGFPCQLMGTGMAFPWAVIEKAELASGHIVEDMKLGLDLALAGTPPLFCPYALVTSVFPVANDVVRSQRTRWEHGHLSMILSEAPTLLREARLRKDMQLLALALDLCVPPLALLGMLVVATMTASLVFFGLTGNYFSLLLSLTGLIFFSLAVLISWWRFGRKILSAANLGAVVGYVLWKIPLYVKFMLKRQVEWVRSGRDVK